MKYIKYTFAIILVIFSLPCFAKEASLTVKFVLTGVDGPAKDNAITSLTACLPEEKKHQHLTREDIESCYAAGHQLIVSALKPFGYFHASVQARGLFHKGPHWTARYAIHTGHRLRITSVSLRLEGQGKQDPELLALLARFPLKPPDPFESPAYETARDQLLQSANQYGWLEATYSTREVQIDLKQNTARIVLVLQTGKRFYFGSVSFGPNPFNPTFLQRFIRFHPDEPFSSNKLLRLQEDLSGSGYFKEVVVTPDMHRVTHQHVPIHVAITPPMAKRYLIGAGYGTFTGPRATLGVDYRRVGDSGQHFTLQARVSSVLKSLSAKYFIPGRNPLTDQYILGADVQKFIPKNGNSLAENLSASRVSTCNEWQHNLSLHFLNEKFRVENLPSESSRVLYPDYTVGWLRTDNRMDPHSARSLRMSIRGSSDKIVSFTSFAQGEIKGRILFSPTEPSRVILRGAFGYTIVNDLSRLPLTLRYFAGGIDSLRGYPYSSIGPGRYLETAGLELQHRIVGNLSGAIFHDVGTATNHLNDTLMNGAGVGLIYHSVVGPVRLYVARALSKPGHPFRIEFSLGPDL